MGTAMAHGSPEGGLLTPEALLERRPTALLVASPAVGATMYEACARAGLRIPADISLVCFSSLRNYFLTPSLAYLEPREPGLERRLVEKLEQLMENPNFPPTRELFFKSLVPGGSIGKCPEVL